MLKIWLLRDIQIKKFQTVCAVDVISTYAIQLLIKTLKIYFDTTELVCVGYICDN